MKMVTSQQYIFPTIDCGDTEREEIRRKEKEARDEVSGTW